MKKFESIGDRIIKFDKLDMPTVADFNKLFPLVKVKEPLTYPVTIGPLINGQLRLVYIGNRSNQIELK